MTTIRDLTAVSALLVDDEDGEHLQLVTYDRAGTVVVAVADEGDEPGVAELDDLLAFDPRCAEALGRELIRVADVIRRGERPDQRGEA